MASVFNEQTIIIAGAVLAMAALYSTVGHGGGSGYLAILALSGVVPDQMRPTALLLNVVVASIGTWKFANASTCRSDLFVPLICASIPAAFLGGFIEVPPTTYKPILGVILLFAAVRLFVPIRGSEKTKRPPLAIILATGAFIGMVSGVVGVGGGIFLSPLVLLLGWATAKQTAAISAPFILVNSLSGIGGIATAQSGLPVDFNFIAPLVIAVIIGGIIGASFGSRRLGHQGLRTVLGVILLIASAKMFLTTIPVTNAIPTVDVKSTSWHTPEQYLGKKWLKERSCAQAHGTVLSQQLLQKPVFNLVTSVVVQQRTLLDIQTSG